MAEAPAKPKTQTRVMDPAVTVDRQWMRRVRQEEINMVDSFGGQMLQKINQARTAQQKNHFYPQGSRMNKGSSAAAATQPKLQSPFDNQSFASRARDSDGLDSVSQVSVLTPKSRKRGPSSHASESVSYYSQKSGSTTVSTKQKLIELEMQLQQEREIRMVMEEKVAALQNKRQ